VAIKRVRWAGDDGQVERVRAEATAVAGLDHPNVVEIVELLDDEDGLVIVMQLAEGGSLGEMLRHRVRMPPREAADLAAKVADALAVAHDLSILHSDVKPSNILIDGNGEQPLLSDFGLSRWTAGPAPRGGSSWARPSTSTRKSQRVLHLGLPATSTPWGSSATSP
jgi:serine/threonine-protein kinase